jgi:hypothetical protein
MIKYRVAILSEGKHLAIYSGEVSDEGKVELPLLEAPAGGVITIEWERQVSVGQ